MAKSVLNDARFHNEQAAFDYVEKQLWPKGPVCPRCRAKGDKNGKLNGKTTRAGLYKCYGCRKPFTVRIGTIFEDSHLPAAPVASGHPSDVRQQERHFDPPASTDAWLRHENRLAPWPPYPRSHGR